MSPSEPPKRVGKRSTLGPELWVCKICSRPMRYWGDEGVWVCDKCQIVAVPTPTESYKMATTYGRGKRFWEYHFHLSSTEKDKFLVTTENLLAVDLTELVHIHHLRDDIFIGANEAGTNVEEFLPGEVKIIEFDNDSMKGFVKLVRSPDDI